MQRFETPYIADWFAISLRWIVLIGLVVSLGLGAGLNARIWPLGLMVIWNLVMTALTTVNMRLRGHRLFNLAFDLLMCALFFWVQGGLQGPAWWVGVYAILTASIYYELGGAVLAAGFSILLVALHFFMVRAPGQAFPVTQSSIYLALGLLFGILGRQLMTRLRQMRQFWLDAELKKQTIQTERLRAIYELTSTLASTLSYKRVLDSALDLGYTALNADMDSTGSDPLVGAILLFKGGQLRVGSARRFTNADLRVTFPGNEGILKRLFDEGDTLLSKDIGYDPELGRVIALRNCTVCYSFPLRSGFNVYGAMLFAHPEPDYFSDDRRALLDVIGRQAVIAIQNARLYQDLVEEKERMIEVHEEARRKLARDLHDGPTQSVAAMAMRVNLARRMLTRDTESAAEELMRIEDLAHRTSKEIRHMLFTLRPLILESQGLTAALQAMADKMQETYGQDVSIDTDEGVVSRMEMGKQGVVFYIVEEAVNNARKHANAPHIWVRLKFVEENMALLEVVDNGLGFDVESVNATYENRGSLGMINLKERTELVSGLLNIRSAFGEGTTVQVYIPFTEESAERLKKSRSQ